MLKRLAVLVLMTAAAAEGQRPAGKAWGLSRIGRIRIKGERPSTLPHQPGYFIG